MLAYHAIDGTENNESNKAIAAANTGETTTEDKKTRFALIECVMKNYKRTFKTHRSVTDSDTGYINKVVSAMKVPSFVQSQEQQQQTSEQGQEQEQEPQPVQERISGSATSEHDRNRSSGSTRTTR
jgi:hypothetical protein